MVVGLPCGLSHVPTWLVGWLHQPSRQVSRASPCHSQTSLSDLSHHPSAPGISIPPSHSTQCLCCATSDLWLKPWLFREALWRVTRSWTGWVHRNTERLGGGRRKMVSDGLDTVHLLWQPLDLPSGPSSPKVPQNQIRNQCTKVSKLLLRLPTPFLN